MALEIERKFLVANDHWRAAVTRSVPMRQGYLTEPGARASVRVRIEGERANLNIKAAVVGPARAEYEYGIEPHEAQEMFDTLCTLRLEKVRHYVPAASGNSIWEIDEFLGDNAGLVVAEIELDTAEQVFDRPDWLGRELTDERRWYNQALAQRPYTLWRDEERV